MHNRKRNHIMLCVPASFVSYNGGMPLPMKSMGHPATQSAVSGRLFQPHVKRPSLNPPRIDINQPSTVTTCKYPLIAVTTTLKSASTNIDEVADLMPVVVVGDEGTVSDFVSSKSSRVTYLSLQQQHALYPQVSKTIPTRSFARKNIGFLHALHLGACCIWDFDDDNFPTDDTKQVLATVQKTGKLPEPNLQLTANEIVVNPYLLYGSPEFIWPRGYPLELLKRKRFPRLEKPTVTSPIDVLQVMQNVDPDVDANWRLEYGRRLPMAWSAAPVIASSCLAISGSNYAPYNAQATLLSRRAATVSLLPHTVHGRVSDIWRSYATQYLIHSLDEPGRIAFSGAFVSHHRNNHSYMADRQAEAQLYEQVSALTLHLKQRTLRANQSNLLQEFVSLYDDLYQRGFVEAGDVRTAIAWAKAVAATIPPPLISQQNLQAIPKSDGPSKHAADVLAAVHVSNEHIEIIPVWMALHAHKFAAVAFYTPGAVAAGISGIQPIRLSRDYRGYFAYESAVDAVEQVRLNRCNHVAFWDTAMNCTAVQGVYFLHDDAVLRNAHFDKNVSAAPSRAALYSNRTTWIWTNSLMGLPAFNKMIIKFNMAMQPWYGQADSFYVARKHFQAFVKIAAKMVELRCSLKLRSQVWHKH